MYRQTIYPQEVLLNTDVTLLQNYAMIAVGKALEAIIGASNLYSGLSCVPTGSPSLTVNVEPGQGFNQLVIDATTFGSLPPDSNLITKQGINFAITPFTITPPSVVGDEQQFLIEAKVVETDAPAIPRAFYNSAGIGLPPIINNVSPTRKDNLVLQVKSGVAAPIGTSVTPTPDSGFDGLWVIKVPHGATTITSGDITLYPSAPFINNTLTQLLATVTHDGTLTGAGTVGSPLGVNTDSLIPTGSAQFYLGTTAPSGYVLINDGTIGSATSGATTRANADTEALYTLVWNSISSPSTNTICPVTGGLGANAAADFAANKPLRLPLTLGRDLACAGHGSGLTDRPLGSDDGSEAVTLAAGNFPTGLTYNSAVSDPGHLHTYLGWGSSIVTDDSNNEGAIPGPQNTSTAVTGVTVTTTGPTGAANTPFSVTGPRSYWNVIVKL